MNRVLLLLLVLLAPALAAQLKDIVGEAAPEFAANNTVALTEYHTLADCTGDVTVIRIF